jgi:hypothetical protein
MTISTKNAPHISGANTSTMQIYDQPRHPTRYPSFHTTDYSSLDLYIDQQRMAAELKQLRHIMRRFLSTQENELMLKRITELDDECEALEECTDHFTLQYDKLMDHVAGHYIWPDLLARERRLIDDVQHQRCGMQEELENLRECLETRIGREGGANVI